jgi:hypothetical protein
MIFRLKLKTFGVLFGSGLLLLSFSCSEFLKGKPEQKPVIEANKENLSCLKDVSKKFSSFLKSEVSEKEVDEVFTCLDATLKEFQTTVEGGVEASAFTAEELFKIFDKFINESQISKETTNDLLVLKTAVLGGSPQKITKKEISDLRNYLNILKVEAKALLPYAQILRLKKEENVFSKKMLQDGFAQLNLSLKNLIKASQVYRSDYQFSDLQRLIINLKILDSDQSELLGLASKVKDLLAGTQALQTESDYFILIDNLTEVLRLYSIHLNGYIKFEMEDPVSLKETIAYAEDWIHLLEKSLQYNRTKLISFETLDPVLTEILKKELIPIKVKPSTLLSFYKTLLVRVFQSGQGPEVNGLNGLTKTHFSNLKQEIAIFKTYLDFIETTPVDKRVPIATIQSQLKTYDPTSRSLFLMKLDEESRKTVLKAFNELKSEFLEKRPVVYRFNKMVIAANQDIWDQNWSDLARAVYVKMLSRELLIGWGTGSTSESLTKASISEAGLVKWYNDFKPFSIEVKAFDPRSDNSGAVSFKQANLLTYSADGDDKMNFLETIQYLNMLISGGGQSLSEIQNGLQKTSCPLPEKDVFDVNWNNEECAIKDLRTNFKHYFSNLSFLVGFTSRMNDQQFAQFYYSVMDVTRIDTKQKGQKVETADLRAMSILLHYIEALYAKFDVDQNWAFSANEIKAAYPRFKNFAKAYAKDVAQDQIDLFNSIRNNPISGLGYNCYSEDDLIRDSFVFLVYNGKTPGKLDLNVTPCIGKRALIDFSGEVDRKKIINTFKILKAVLGS